MSRILVTHSPTLPVRLDLVTEALPDWDVAALELPPGGVGVDAEDRLTDALSDREGLLLRPGAVTRSVLEAAPELRVVAVHGSGYDHVDVAAATEAGVVVTHSPEAPAPSVVEHTFALCFTMLRELPRRFEMTDRGEWAEARDDVLELGGRTLGVVGLGTVGFRVARHAARVFDADVAGYDPYVSGERQSAIYPRADRETVEGAGVELVSLEALLDRSDLVTLHVPLTDETEGLIGEAELRRLGPGYLVNCARGGVVDEEAAAAALHRGDLTAAAFDVFEAEPPTPDNPLRSAPNAYLTPHVAGVTPQYLERAARAGARKIETVLDGGRPDTVVNPEVFADG